MGADSSPGERAVGNLSPLLQEGQQRGKAAWEVIPVRILRLNPASVTWRHP